MGVISEAEAMEIVRKFLRELRRRGDLLALYVIGSLGGGYYRPGQSDIDTVIVVRDDAMITQERVNKIANKYWKRYKIPKGFGSVMIRESELSPPYLKSEIFEMWADRELEGIDKLQITGCVNTILMHLRRYLIIEKGVFEFNKFRMIDAYLRSGPPLVDEQAFDFILKKLKGEVTGSDADLQMLRACGEQFRDYFNRRLLNLETAGGHHEA